MADLDLITNTAGTITCKLWLEADTLQPADSKVLSTSPFDGWHDKSGNDNDFTMAGAASQVIDTNATPTGQKALRFDGTYA